MTAPIWGKNDEKLPFSLALTQVLMKVVNIRRCYIKSLHIDCLDLLANHYPFSTMINNDVDRLQLLWSDSTLIWSLNITMGSNSRTVNCLRKIENKQHKELGI